jgi:hypothetical protein
MLLVEVRIQGAPQVNPEGKDLLVKKNTLITNRNKRVNRASSLPHAYKKTLHA